MGFVRELAEREHNASLTCSSSHRTSPHPATEQSPSPSACCTKSSSSWNQAQSPSCGALKQ